MKYYAAGGAIRDLLLGQPLRDVDYVFAATEEKFIQRNPAARKIQSTAYPIYVLGGQEFSPLFRQDMVQDLLRRDFTINALLLSEDGMLRMHPLALADLRTRQIRPASSSSLADDPVRVFRAARLAARLPEFSLHAEVLTQMRALAAASIPDAQNNNDKEQSPVSSADGPSLYAIPAEQAGNETRKACLADRPGNFLRALHQGDCLSPWFTEFARAACIPAGPPGFRDSSVLEHSSRLMDATAAMARRHHSTDKERAVAVWMALCHDIGKNATSGNLLPHHYGHETRGAAMAEVLGLRLRLPNLFVKAGRLSSLLHMKAGRYKQLRPGVRTDMLMRLHAAGLVSPFAWMAAADSFQEDLPLVLRRDLERLLSVRLPEHWREKGELSGLHLRELRCMAISKV